jgi:uncharacterized protein YgiM (DUF1202 family)
MGRKAGMALFVLLLLWLILSSIFNRSPVGLMMATVDYMLGSANGKPSLSYTQLKNENERKDSLIAELQNALEMLKKSSGYQQAMVKVESESLNMRNKPALGSEVVLQLPVGTVVEVLYYDNETQRIGGDYGKWCKVRYAGTEGWVWGNYLELID